MVLRRTLLQALGSALIFRLPTAAAQDKRLLRIVIPYGPGGIVDSLGRLLAEAVRSSLGRDVIVENKPGGGGMIATRSMMGAPNDGSTVLLQNLSNYVAQPLLLKEATYDPATSLTPVVSIGSTPGFLYTNAIFPARNVKELIAFAKANPKRLDFATTGFNTIGWVKLMQFQKMAGIEVSMIPYKGGDEMTVALRRGEVQAMLTSPTGALNQQIAAGAIRVLGVSTLERSKLDPQLPTLAESVPGYSAGNWWAFFAPKGTRLTALTDLSNALQQVLVTPKIRQQFAALYVDAMFQGADAVTKELSAVSLDLKRLTTELKVEPQ